VTDVHTPFILYYYFVLLLLLFDRLRDGWICLKVFPHPPSFNLLLLLSIYLCCVVLFFDPLVTFLSKWHSTLQQDSANPLQPISPCNIPLPPIKHKAVDFEIHASRNRGSKILSINNPIRETNRIRCVSFRISLFSTASFGCICFHSVVSLVRLRAKNAKKDTSSTININDNRVI